MSASDPFFPDIVFKGKLRPSQKEVADIAIKHVCQGRKRLHVVAPPGSGKTVTGLYIWARCVKKPALVLSPNSAIQAQWVGRSDLFASEGAGAEVFSADPERPALLTSLTYQSVTLPRRGGEESDEEARELWERVLVEKGEAEDPAQAGIWIDSLAANNRDYFEDRLSAYRKMARDEATLSGGSFETLHKSSIETLERLRDIGVGLLVLDECHHLLGHWGRVLADIGPYLGDPVVLGLTATPPDTSGKRPEDVERYSLFLGDVDYEVPAPAVVKDGFLAPYQDLAYFVRPTAEEMSYIANADDRLLSLVERLCRDPGGQDGARAADAGSSDAGPLSLAGWVYDALANLRLPTGQAPDWRAFEKRDPLFSEKAREFLAMRGLDLPPGVPPLYGDPDGDLVPDTAGARSEGGRAEAMLETAAPVLDRYVRHYLRHSSDPAAHRLAEDIKDRLRVLGVQITETGSQACASPVSRVLAYSRAKALALVPILGREREVLADSIRAVVIADFERSSAVSSEVSHLLDEEAGGAVAAFRALLGDPATDELDPVLVTGSSVLVDDDLAPGFAEASRRWLEQRSCRAELSLVGQGPFFELRGKGPDWCPRIYVSMITDLFQEGITRCLVGTRGLLGEGWDAAKINVLVDLTTVTTSMTVNQLRGRSIRIDADNPKKLADNWDVICVAPEFLKGLDDYKRFIKKHQSLYGVTDDGVIEKGVGHVHAAFTEIEPEGVQESGALLNDEMLARAGLRGRAYELWRVGEPYRAEPVRAVEVRGGGGGGGFPPFAKSGRPWSDHSLTLAIGAAVRAALLEAGLVGDAGEVRAGERAGGYVRLYLESGEKADRELFAVSLSEALSPYRRARYIIPRYVNVVKRRWLSKLLPEVLDRYLGNKSARLAMYHAVPGALARNKDLAAMYGRHWNRFVSPGDPVYAFQGKGEETLGQARSMGLVPGGEIHDKEIFI